MLRTVPSSPLTWLLLFFALPLAARADVHVFTIDGYQGYKGDASGSTVIAGPYFMGKTYTVEDSFSLSLESNGSSKTNRIVTGGETVYGTLYQHNLIKIKPMRDCAVTRVRIATVNDMSRGFVDNDDKSLSRNGAVYEWKGKTASTLKIRVVSEDANNYLGFTYIEVTYGNEFTPDDPDDPDNPVTPGEIADVIISPDLSLISPDRYVTLSCDTEGSTIYYTTDGSRPTASSLRYSRPFRLSLSSGCDVRALAVAPDGQTSESQRRYYFDTVGSIPDFFTNGSWLDPVTLDTRLQLVYLSEGAAYLRDTRSYAAEYVCVDDSRGYLRGIAPGRIVNGISAVTGYDRETPAAVLMASPGVVASAAVPAPDTVALRTLSYADLHRFVAVKGCVVSGRGTVSQGGTIMALDDRFDVVGQSMTDTEATVTAFVALGRAGEAALRPIRIETAPASGNPDDPSDPGGNKEKCQVNSICVGDGTVEIFGGYNSYTLTPEGALLVAPFAVAWGSEIYLYFKPGTGVDVASVVAGARVVPGDSDDFVSTLYGRMLPLKIEGDVTVVTTFAARAGIAPGEADVATAPVRWYDLAGRRLPAAPSVPGIYIRCVGTTVAVIRLTD